MTLRQLGKINFLLLFEELFYHLADFQQLRFFRHLHSSSTALGNFEFKSYLPQVSDRERARTEKLQTTRSGQAIAALENPSLKIYLLP